jgi:DNA invertase Pin-like site-specific DNA recombinase
VSKDAQDRRSQVGAIEQWLTSTKRTAAEWIEDAGGRDIAWKRAGFQKIIARVERGEIAWVAVSERDRFGVQDAEEWGYYVTILRRHNCELWVAAENKNLAAREDRTESFMAAINSERSRSEQEARAQREHRSKLALVERGEWPGGKPPYGFDLVCKRDGRDLWRLVYEPGVYRRKQLLHDGKTRRFDGKDNVPARSKGETLHLAINQEQAKWVRKIFEWFLVGDSFRSIANRLQALGVPSLNRAVWHHSSIAFIVGGNPAYVLGVPVWNKFGHGRFIERVNGQWVAVERIGGRTRNARKRDTDDHVHAPPAIGIVDEDTWNKAQRRLRKLKAEPRVARKPKSPDLYFAGLVRCRDCGKLMIADAQFQRYRCPTSMIDKTACWCNTVPHARLVEYVDRWLADTEQTVTAIDPEWCVMIMEQEDATVPLIKEYTQRITAMWREARSIDKKELHWTYKKLRSLVGADAGLDAMIKEKEGEIARLTERVGQVRSDAAVVALLRRIDAIGEEVRELKARLEVNQLDSLRLRLREMVCRLDEARELAPVRRASAMRELIGEILPRHEHYQRGKLRASRLLDVEITPRVGDMSRGERPRRSESSARACGSTSPGSMMRVH